MLREIRELSVREVISAAASLLVLWLMFPIFFNDRKDLFESIRFWFIPDVFSVFRGEYWLDSWAEWKLFIWLACAVAVGYGVYRLF